MKNRLSIVSKKFLLKTSDETKQPRLNIVIKQKAYLGPCQTSMMKIFN